MYVQDTGKKTILFSLYMRAYYYYIISNKKENNIIIMLMIKLDYNNVIFNNTFNSSNTSYLKIFQF